MQLVQGYLCGYSGLAESLGKTESTLDRILAEESADGIHQVTAADLESINVAVRSAVAFMKAVKHLSSEKLRESMRLEEMINAALDAEQNPYAYATSNWSKDNLAMLDEYTQASIKRILRDYFAKLGLSYEGWV